MCAVFKIKFIQALVVVVFAFSWSLKESMACEAWNQKLEEHSSEMPCLALGRMSSGTGEQMYSRNRLRQCLHSELKRDSETNAKQSQSQSPPGIVLHHVKQRNLCAIPNKTIKLYFVTPNHKPNNTYLNSKGKRSVNILTSFTKKKIGTPS